MKRTLSLRTGVVLLIGAVMCIVMGAATGRAYERRNSDLAVAVERLRDRVNLVAQQQAALFRHTEDLVDILVSSNRLADFGTSSFCSATLGNYLEHNPGLDNLVLALPDGDVVCDAQSAKKINIGDRPHFKAALAVQNMVIGAPLVSRMTGHWVLPFARVMRAKNGAPEGVLVASINLDNIGSGLATSSYFKQARFGLVDSHGVVLSLYPDPLHLTGKDVAETPIFHTIVAQGGSGSGERIGIDGKPQMYAATHFADTTAGAVYVWMSVSKSLVTAAANREFAEAIAIALAICAGAFACIWFAGEHYFIRPLHAISNTAQRLGTGDYQARTGVSHTQGEMGSLAAIFDRMAVVLTSESETLKLNRALKVLSGCGNVLVRTDSELELLDGICKTIVEAGGYPFAWIGFSEDEPAQAIRPVARFGRGTSYLEQARINWTGDEYSKGPAGRAIRSGITQVDQDLEHNPAMAQWRAAALEHGFRAAVALPLKERGSVFGVLNIYAFETNAFKREEVELLEQLTDDLAFGILSHRAKLQQRRAEELAERLARYDVVTDLPNRGELIAHLIQACERAQRENSRLEVLVASIDQWSDIGDALGMAGADDIMRQLRKRLFTQIGQVHFVARYATDAFTVVVPAGIEQPASIAANLNTIFDEPLEYAGIPVDVRITVGIAIFPEHATEPDVLLRRAAIAARQARAAGQLYAVYSGAAESENPERLVLLSDLRKAIRDDALTLFFQPKVALSQQNVSSVEALVRWNDEVRGMVSPAAFIPLAEHTGLIKPLTHWVLGAALRQAADWQRMGHSIRIAVNVSPNNLRDPEFFDQLISMPQQFGARLDLLDLEITETALMEDPTQALELLERVSDLGMRIFIDDFGTGYSSLAYLAALPIHALKIDRSFVIRMDQPRYRAIVECTISMAHALGLKVVAEGVDQVEIAEALAAEGCNEIQGFLYSKPLPADELLAWRESFNRRSASA